MSGHQGRRSTSRARLNRRHRGSWSGLGTETLERRDLLAVSLINLPGTNPPGLGFTAGVPFSGQIATFVAADGATDASRYSGTMDWGDGFTSAVSISYDPNTNAAAGGTFDVLAAHTYRAPGPETMTLTIDDGWDTTTAPASATITVADQTLAPTPTQPTPQPAAQGVAMAPTDLATFTDANPMALASDFSATIQWGDGTSEAGSVSRDAGGTFHVTGGHTYGHPSPSGGYQLSMEVSDGPSSLLISNTLAVTPAPLVLGTSTVFLAADSQDAQGQAIIPAGTVVGSFTQAGQPDPVANYESSASYARFVGSGAVTPLVVTPSPGGGPDLVTTAVDTVISPYLVPGPTPFSLQVADTASGALATAVGSVVVSDVAPTPSLGQPTLAATVGMATSGAVAAFNLDFGGTQDLSSLYHASINWGDNGPDTTGTIRAGTAAGEYVVLGSHTYADIGAKLPGQAAGTASVTVTVTRLGAGGASTTIGGTFTVADAPIAATAIPVSELDSTSDALGEAIVPAGVEVGTFTQIGGPRLTTAYAGSTATFPGASGPTPLAFTFDPASGIFTARTSAATVISPDLTPGSTPFSLQIVDGVGGATASSASSLQVADVKAVATPTQPSVGMIEGRPFSGAVATFILPYGAGQDLSGQFTASIDWGDGTPTTVGTVQPGSTPGTYQVVGGHIYAGIGTRIANQEAGTSPIAVQVARAVPSGVGETFSNAATITDAPITLTATNAYLADSSVDAQGNSVVPAGTVVGTFQQVGGARLASAYSGSTATFAGSTGPTPLTITPMSDGTDFLAVTAAATKISPYLVPGPFAFSVQVVDGIGGATATASASLVASDVAPAASAQQPSIVAVQGQTFSGAVANFRLAFGAGQDLAGLYSAMIDWGDGSTPTAGTIQPGTAANTYVVTGTHTYADIGTKVPGQAVGTNPVVVTIARLGAYGASKAIDANAMVADAPIAALSGPIFLADTSSNAKGQAIVPAGEIVATFTQSGASRPASAFFGSAATFAGSASPTPLGIWRNPTTGAYVAYTAADTVIQPYLRPGTSAASIQVVDGVGGATAAASATLAVSDAAPIVTTAQPSLNAKLNAPFIGAVAAFATPYAKNQDLSSQFGALINWGDGSAPSPGIVRAGSTPGTYQVLGAHTYTGVGTPIPGRAAGTYPVSVIVARLGGSGSSNVAGNSAVVQDAPNYVGGALSPSSDSGVSALDGLTNTPRPAFSGITEPGATVLLMAIPAFSTTSTPVGTTTADASGHWALATSPLADGSYTIDAVSVDRFGLSPTSAQLIPNAVQGFLTIATAPPRVAGVQFNPNSSQVAVTFEDSEDALNLASVLNPSAYQFSAPGVAASALAATGPVLVAYDPSGRSATVMLTLDGGRRFPKKSVNLTIQGTSIGDVAGNLLDGTYLGQLPSGSGQAGSNFSATIPLGVAPPAVTLSASSATPQGPTASTSKAKAASVRAKSPAPTHPTRPVQAHAVAAKHGK